MHQFAIQLPPPVRAPRPTDRPAFDPEVGLTTRSREVEADQALVLSDEWRRPELVRPPTSLASSDAGAWGSGSAATEVDLIDVMLCAQRGADTCLGVRVACVTAGRSFDEIVATRVELRRAKPRLEQTERGVATRRVRA